MEKNRPSFEAKLSVMLKILHLKLLRNPIHGRSFILCAFICIKTGLLPLAAMNHELWTLDEAVRRIRQVSPEIREAAASVRAREGVLHQAGRWPNPQIGVIVNDQIGTESGTGGINFTQFVFSQPLPISGRLSGQKNKARVNLEAALASQEYQQLLQEARAAQVFHIFQLATAKFRLAQERLALADTLQEAGRRRDQAGELARLARLRLDIIRETAQQTIDRDEGEFNEALNLFQTYLALPYDIVPQLLPLKPIDSPPALSELEVKLRDHPALIASKSHLEAARLSITLAKAERLPDPVLSFYQGRDFLNGRSQDITGVGVAITIPAWDMKKGRIREAHAQEAQAQARVDALNRDLTSRLHMSHLHLTHLIHQEEEFRKNVLTATNEFFELTQKAYVAGEAGILALIDANDIYFESHDRYLELLQEAWLEAAELRLAAGLSVLAKEKGVNP